MIDIEKVIKGLELCKQDAKLCFSETECPYQCEFPRCCLKLMADALELLKEQEPIAPSVCGSKEPDEHGVCCWRYLCGKCKKPIDHKDRFCKRCGKAVKWDA